jgi:Gp157 protein
MGGVAMKLYEIPLEANAIEEQLYDQVGELTPELEQRIKAFLSQGKDKIESAAVVINSLEEDSSICQAEAKRLIERAAQLNQSADRLRGMVLCAVDLGFGGKVKTPKFTIWGQTSAPVTHFDLKAGADIYQLMATHPELVRASDPELNKSALKEAVRTGGAMPEEIAVVKLEGTRFLRIK